MRVWRVIPQDDVVLPGKVDYLSEHQEVRHGMMYQIWRIGNQYRFGGIDQGPWCAGGTDLGAAHRQILGFWIAECRWGPWNDRSFDWNR